jgi:long-chain acyl-CoA synthetase
MAPTITSGSLEYWAHEKPTSIALIDGDRSISYGEWNDSANRIANALAARGIVADDIVVMRTHIRIEWALVASALAKLGCSLLGLNWRLTPSEIEYVLGNSGAQALVCDDADPEQLIAATRVLPIKLLVSIEQPAPGFVSLGDLLQGETQPRYSHKDPALIIYTSGTTGLPKGVTMGRRSPFFTDEEVLEYQRDVRHARKSDAANPVVLVTMPMHHGAGPAQLWGALRSGRKCVLMRRFDPEQALRLMHDYKITDWNSVPTMLKRIAGLSKETLARYDVTSIQHLSVGAAPVPYSLKEWVFDYFGETCLTEGYGATEVGMVTRLTADMQRKKPGSSGLPYKHVHIEIRDVMGGVLDANQSGEIWIRTPTTIGRYLNGKELDRETLDEFGFFRVGDVGHLDEDGYLFITDRKKDLIISGGVNLYPAEIEAAIIKHPAIQDAAVIGIPDDEFGEQVKAFCELKPDRSVTAQALQSFLTDHLASYKRPKTIDFVPELPRNTMGKLLKRELREPYWKDRERKV